MSMANRHGQGAVFTIGLMYSQLFSCWFHLNNQMLVLRPSMVDLIIHFDPSCPPQPPLPFMDSFWKLCEIQDAGTKRIPCGPLDGHAT